MVEFDFSHLEVDGTDEADFTMFFLDGHPKLTLSPAGEANKPYFNEFSRRMRQRQAQLKISGINAEMIKAHRNDDRENYPMHVIKGWDGIRDREGNLVAFTQENVRAFIAALPNELFDLIREFAQDLSNFRPGIMTPASMEEVAGN